MERKDKKEGIKLVASKKQKAVLFMPKSNNTSEKDQKQESKSDE